MPVRSLTPAFGCKLKEKLIIGFSGIIVDVYADKEIKTRFIIKSVKKLNFNDFKKI